MYKATIFELGTPRPHPNADRLQIFTIMGYQVITSLDYKEGDKGIFFPPDGQVSEEYAEKNDLIERRDADGNRAGGYMSHKRRIKAISLRGEKSQGLWLPIGSLDYIGKGATLPSWFLNHGDELDSYQTHPICNKYYTPATQAAREKTLKSRRETPMFRRHIDTKKLQQKIGDVPYGYPFIITEKVHGTSGRFGRVLEEYDYPIWHWKRWTGKKKKEWVYLSGSRNVIHRTYNDLQQGYYENNSFRNRVIEPLKGNLHKGEVIYYEIVGWESEDKPIMDAVNTAILRDKSYKELYGDTMYYKYGCPNGECKLLVYRIVMTNEDGVSYDLTWDQVKKRCEILGVEYVHEICTGYHVQYNDLLYITAKEWDYTVENVETETRNMLLGICEGVSTGDSHYDITHMKEGVVLRIETGEPTPHIYKYKSHEFLVLEGHTKDREDYIDPEEIA